MVLFNDPVPCPDPAARAVRMAVAMREAVRGLAADWQRRGFELGFGVGIAQGRRRWAGSASRAATTTPRSAASPICAARLCARRPDGQILVSEPVAEAVRGLRPSCSRSGPVALKGFQAAVPVYAVPATMT